MLIQEDRLVPNLPSPVRLDRAAADLFPEFSRSRLQVWIRDGSLTVNGIVRRRPRELVAGGERLQLEVVLEADPEERGQVAEPMNLPILFEDEHLLLVNKPAGLVVQPAAGNWSGTLLNGLLHHHPANACLPRAGIVHRLDKDTTGVLVVAKTLIAHKGLVTALQERRISRTYFGLVYGRCPGAGVMEAPIGRHPRDRLRMAVRQHGKSAKTWFRVMTAFTRHSLLELKLDTGRTHQIRVHLAHLGYPLIGDRLYGGHYRAPGRAGAGLANALLAFQRQALHAQRLQFEHPCNRQTPGLQCVAP